MSRPQKSGVDYFPLDVVLDDKFALIEAEFGLKGFAVIVKLFQKIYGGQGYYCEWTEEVELLFSRSIGMSGNSVSEIVKASMRRGIFDTEMFERHHILTSKGIQERYLEAVSRRKNVEIEKNYLLLNANSFSDNVNINSDNVNINSKNDNNNSQSKVKESKVKESKGKESKVKHIAVPDEILPEWNSYIEMRKTIKKPMTDKAKELALKKLEQLSNGSIELKKAILNQSVFNCWQGLFKLKESNNGADGQCGCSQPEVKRYGGTYL